MNKLLTLSLALACSAVMLAEPVSSQSIIVSPTISHDQFVEKVSQNLDRQLRRVLSWNGTYGQGIAIVRFSRDSEGAPENVTLYRKSGNSTLDRKAARAVRGLDSLGIVPAGVQDDQVFQANIVFASNERDRAILIQRLDTMERDRIAAARDDEHVFAFGSSAIPQPTS